MKKLPEGEQARVALFAAIANIETLDTLSPGERLVLKEQAEKVFFPCPQLSRLHEGVRDFLTSLLGREGKKVQFPLPLTWGVEDGELRQGVANVTPQESFWTDLFRMGQLKPFPFRRCPQCQRIYVVESERQQFCSQRCRRQAKEAKEQKRDYMRPYMAARREEEKKRAEATQKALARSRAGKLPAGAKEFAEDLQSLPVLPVETDEERSSRQQAEQKRLREILEKRRQTTTRQGRKEK